MKRKQVALLLTAATLVTSNTLSVFANDLSENTSASAVLEGMLDESEADESVNEDASEETDITGEAVPTDETENTENVENMESEGATPAEVAQPEEDSAETPALVSAAEPATADVQTAMTDLAVGDTFEVDSITYKVTSNTDMLEAEPISAPMRLTELVIPGAVTYNGAVFQVSNIPDGAFFGNHKTTKIVISEGIKTMSASAFQGAVAVKELVLPSTLETFTTMGFPSLGTISLAEGNSVFSVVDNALFAKDGSKLFLYPSGSPATSYAVPEGTVIIGDSAFYENKYLQTIEFPNTVTTIEDYAFDTVNALTSITLGSNISHIGTFNFTKCPKLKAIALFESGRLGDYCLNDCTALETIIIDGELNGYGTYAFYNLPSLKSYEVRNSRYYSAKDGALYKGAKLLRYPSGKENSVFVVPDETDTIGGLAFNYMQHTTEVILPPQVYLDLMAFHYPNLNAPISVYFRDKDKVNISSSKTGVFVGLTAGSHIYLRNEKTLQDFLSYASAVNPQDSASIEVKTIPATELTLNETKKELKARGTFALEAAMTPYYTTDSISWTTSDPAIATVSQDGIVTATGFGDCVISARTDSGITVPCEISVVQTDIATLTADEIVPQPYNGSALSPEVNIINEDYSLQAGTDYTITYESNKNAGTAKAILTGIGDYKGTKEISFTITPKDFMQTTVSDVSRQEFTGKAITPVFTVKDGEAVLKEGQDYAVSYKDNEAVGTATITVTGKGNYSNTQEITFSIYAKDIASLNTTAIPEQEYTGAALTPRFSMIYGTSILAKDVDYTAVFESNTDIGTAKVTVTGTGNYTGTKEISFKINAKDIKKTAISAIPEQEYTGAAFEPEITVTDGERTLQQHVDYRVSFEGNTNAGTAKVIVTGMGNYSGTKEEAFQIAAKSMDKISAAAMADVEYNGKAQKPVVSLSDGEKKLKEGKDYSILYQNNKKVGTAKVVVTGAGNYSGTKELTFRIGERSITKATFSDLKNQVYTGASLTAAFTVKDFGEILKEGKDYLVLYKDNTNAGTAQVIVTGIGDYVGNETLTFTITPKAFKEVSIHALTDQIYSGNALTPEVKATDREKSLVQDQDYTVSYKENTNAGTAKVTVTGKGNYAGTQETTFQIQTKKLTTKMVFQPKDQVYTGKGLTPVISVIDGKNTLTKDKDYTLIYENNQNVGTAKAIITGTGNYTGATEVSFQITAKDVAALTDISVTDPEYTGEALTPDAVIRYGETVLKAGKDYTVTYKNNTKVGNATMTITGKGNYTGKKEISFKINQRSIGKASFSKLKDQVYTGSENPAALTIKDFGKELEAGKDYTITYENYIFAGTAKVTVTGTGNYTGEEILSYEIQPKELKELSITELKDQVYTGAAFTPEISLKDGDILLQKNTDYTVSYDNNEAVGTATATVLCKGNYTGKKEMHFEIQPKQIFALSISQPENEVYTGVTLTPEITVMDGETVLKENKDYTIAYSHNKAAGTAIATITCTGNYAGEKEVSFQIAAKDVAELTDISVMDQEYTGEAFTPEIVIRYGEMVLEVGKDYTVAYENNTEIGTATVLITGKGNFVGETKATFRIGERSITKATVSAIEDITYQGAAYEPEVVVTDGTTVLEKGKDYTVAYKNNVNAGEGKVIITGMGTYIGSLEQTFTIHTKAFEHLEVLPTPAQVFIGTEVKPELSVTENGMILEANKDYTVSYENNVHTGTATAIVTGIGNYTGTQETSFEIHAMSMEQLTMEVVTDQVYTGNALTPDIILKNGKMILLNGTDYELSYENNTEIGTATILVTGKGDYKGILSAKFQIKEDVPEFVEDVDKEKEQPAVIVEEASSEAPNTGDKTGGFNYLLLMGFSGLVGIFAGLKKKFSHKEETED